MACGALDIAEESDFSNGEAYQARSRNSGSKLTMKLKRLFLRLRFSFFGTVNPPLALVNSLPVLPATDTKLPFRPVKYELRELRRLWLGRGTSNLPLFAETESLFSVGAVEKSGRAVGLSKLQS
jgi:hypothetical protein